MLKRMLSFFTLPLLLLLLMPPPNGWALSPPEAFAPGPDVIVGDLPSLIQAGSSGTQVGLAMGTDTCNNGDVELNFFAMPNTDHPVMPQNLYRMSGGANNDDRFEQIGQSWVKHAFFALQNNACGFGCTPGSGTGTHLGMGCSTSDTASLNGSQSGLGSRAWVNPFTGIFPSTANSHTGHTHDGTTHRILVEGNDLDPAMNPGATYYGEAQLVTPHEYAWCQAHPGQCNMYNNTSYRQFSVAGTTSFTFSPVGSTVRMTPAINAWPGATIQTIEPEPGVDGRAFIAYKVTGAAGLPGIWYYEYAIYNENLDRGIQSFSVPGGCGFGTPTNLEFHAPLNHPGIANDGTVGDAGYSNAPWTPSTGPDLASWSTETFAQNPNANALRWGTLYNFRFRAGTPPTPVNATIGFFKTGAPIIVPVLSSASECPPSPTPTPFTPPPSPTATATPLATPTPTATPTATICGELLGEQFDNVIPPALPPGWSSTTWVTTTSNPDTAPNCAFIDDPAFLSDRDLVSPFIVVVSDSATVAFRNNYNLESNGNEFFDGGVLEISSPNINGGAFTDITDPAVGASFLSGGYDAKISPDFGSPIGGRQAWSGNSGGYISSVVNLGPKVNGQNIRLKFRMVSDNTGAGVGWRIDTMVFGGICGTVLPTPTPTATPTPTPPATPSPTPSPGVTPTPSPGTPTPTASPPPTTKAVNLSTRMRVQTGDNVGIGGFIISGPAPKRVLLRAIGPSLTGLGVPGVLADPVLELHGSGTFTTVINNNWRDFQEQEIQATGIPPTNNLESALVLQLVPGSYTAIVRGNGDTAGVVLIELYDLTQGVDSRLANISTRAFVSTGDNIVIAGFTLGGSTNHDRIVLRGIGPSLTAFGVPGALANPTLELRDNNGALLRANNDWQDDPAQAAEITAAGLAPTNALESGIAATLAPGAYTALLAGLNNGTGIGVVEVYDRGQP